MEDEIKQAVEGLNNLGMARGHARPLAQVGTATNLIHGVAERHRQREELHNTPTVMTAPEVIRAIEGLHERLRTLQGVAYELASELVGEQRHDGGAPKEPSPPRNVFERMGVELLATTRTLDAIDRDIHACLVAVRP